MDFLKNKGFTKEQIESIINKYDDDTLDTFKFNQDIVEEIIDYMNEFGIKDIPKLMLERIDIFYLPKVKIEELFSHYEKESIIKALEYDSTIFDEMI